MRKTRKATAVLIAATLSLLSLAGCGGSGQAQSSGPSQAASQAAPNSTQAAAAADQTPVEIEYLNHKSETEAINAMDALIKKFMEEYPYITVTQTTTPDFATVITTRAQTNEMPDVFSCTTNTSYELMFQDGLILDLTGQEFLKNVEAETVALSELDGRNWRLPYSLSIYGLYVKTEDFEKNNIPVPTTYDELISATEKLKAAGITPFITPDKDLGLVSQRMERIMGIINEECNTEFQSIVDGTLEPADSLVLNTFADVQNMITKNTTPDSMGVDVTASYQNFLKGEGAMLISGSWALATLKTYDSNVKVQMIPFPNPTGKATKVPISIDTSFAISSSTKHQEACLKFLEFLSRTENAQIYCDGEGSPNSVLGVEYKVQEFAPIMEKVNNGEIFVSLNAVWPSGLRNTLRDFVQQLITDQDKNAFIEAAAAVLADFYSAS